MSGGTNGHGPIYRESPRLPFHERVAHLLAWAAIVLVAMIAVVAFARWVGAEEVMGTALAVEQWINTATVSVWTADDRPALVLAVSDTIPPPMYREEIARKVACGSSHGVTLVYLLVRMHGPDVDGEESAGVPVAVYHTTVVCPGATGPQA